MTCFNGNGLLLAYTPFDVGCENFVVHVYRETKKLFFKFWYRLCTTTNSKGISCSHAKRHLLITSVSYCKFIETPAVAGVI